MHRGLKSNFSPLCIVIGPRWLTVKNFQKFRETSVEDKSENPNVWFAFAKDHPCITSAHFSTFSHPPYVSINSSKNCQFLTPPAQSLCWCNIGMVPMLGCQGNKTRLDQIRSNCTTEKKIKSKTYIAQWINSARHQTMKKVRNPNVGASKKQLRHIQFFHLHFW